MKTEQIMQPRYEVVSDYPDTVFKVGQIIQQEEVDEGQDLYDMNFFSKYPHLFRELEWWEKRDVKDMPEYVKFTETGVIRKVTEWKNISKVFGMEFTYPEAENMRNIASECNILPSTETEYLNFKKGL